MPTQSEHLQAMPLSAKNPRNIANRQNPVKQMKYLEILYFNGPVSGVSFRRPKWQNSTLFRFPFPVLPAKIFFGLFYAAV
jgi:hypothetical protein